MILKIQDIPVFFSEVFIYAEVEKKNVKNMEQCPTRYILDLNKGNLEAKITIKENNLTVKLQEKLSRGKSKLYR